MADTLDDREMSMMYFRIGRIMEDAFVEFDRLKDREGFTDEQMIEAVSHAAGFDVADSYEEWIAEGTDD